MSYDCARMVRNIVEMTFGPKFTDLHFSPKERQLQKSCVSFEEECIVCAMGFVDVGTWQFPGAKLDFFVAPGKK